MSDMQKVVTDLRNICEQQYYEIERKKVQLLDIEEENRVLLQKVASLQDLSEKYNSRINELERWCGHLQGIIDKEAEEREARAKVFQKREKRFGVFYKIARKIYRKMIK